MFANNHGVLFWPTKAYFITVSSCSSERAVGSPNARQVAPIVLKAVTLYANLFGIQIADTQLLVPVEAGQAFGIYPATDFDLSVPRFRRR